ncbi:MAG TPA: hypothetical protein ENH85_00250 [Candidatus Scalindua sp.]|nr:hypothetical protein [Candidatus Scalindua sp.]
MGLIVDLLKDIPLSAVIKEKLIEAEKKLSVFEKQNKYLQANLDQATKEIESLKKLNQELQRAANQEIEKHDEVTEQILRQFFKTGKELSPGYFASSLSLEISVIEYHFDILIKNGYINHASSNRSFITGQSSTTYLISPQGREYIMKNT